uniref:Uncharacterized protein n=1 Tax=viral metagenome TaxID=1070528 RepID=A0A6C0DBG4_9ZZZZ
MVDRLTKDLLNKVITEIKKEDNQKKIEIEILNPLLIKFSNKIYPYIKLVSCMFILHFVLIVIILILIIIYNQKKNIITYNGIQ